MDDPPAPVIEAAGPTAPRSNILDGSHRHFDPGRNGQISFQRGGVIGDETLPVGKRKLRCKGVDHTIS